MALGDPYAAASALELRLGRSDDGTFTSVLDAASRHVERFCQRQFNTDGAVSAREYEPDDEEFLAVDDFHTSTGLIIDVDGTAVDLTDVVLEPRNGIVEGQTGWPFFQIFARTALWSVWSFPLERQVITVTANWGWAAVPAGIVEATLDVAQAMSTGVGAAGTIQSERYSEHSVTFFDAAVLSGGDGVPDVLAKAVPYRRKRWGIA